MLTFVSLPRAEGVARAHLGGTSRKYKERRNAALLSHPYAALYSRVVAVLPIELRTAELRPHEQSCAERPRGAAAARRRTAPLQRTEPARAFV